MTDHARYTLQFILADGKHIDCPEVVARSQAEAEAFALATIGPTMGFAAPIVGVWFVDSEPVHLAPPPTATPRQVGEDAAALERARERGVRQLAAITAADLQAIADVIYEQGALDDVAEQYRGFACFLLPLARLWLNQRDAATNDIIASLRAALKRQAERHGEPLPLVYFRGILGDEV
jgi:hypothetical protein